MKWAMSEDYAALVTTVDLAVLLRHRFLWCV